MKHIVYTILFAILAAQAFSQDVDEKTARVVAERFFLNNYGHKASVENVIVKQYKGHESIYYCNLDRGGWVAVPANRNLNPVVAHSDEGRVDLNDAPQVFLDWMEQYEFVVDIAREEKWDKEDRHKKWDELLSDDFDEQNVLKSYVNHTVLISSKWGQSIPNHGGSLVLGYNSWMPINSSCYNGRCPAGCVAVAIGQIMNYWGYSTGDYSDFNWWTMPDSLDYYNSTNYDEEQASVSYLLKRIGDRTSMDYCKNGKCSSEADPQEYAPYALENFGYMDDMDYKRKSLHTYNQWVNILKTEILAERPVLYRYIGHHAFVCDGYDSSNDNFHFNFGWRGDCDMWVDFEDIDKHDCQHCSQYTSLLKHACIVNIRPNVSSAINLTNKIISTPSNATWSTNTTYQAKNYISAAGNSTTVTIMNNASCRFVAGDSIILKPGFHAQPGSSLLCKIFKRPTLKEGELTESDEFSIITYSDDEDNENSLNNESANSFEVYPNPAKNEITISLKSSKEKDVNLVQIYNSIGVLMLERTTDKPTITVDISDFPMGQYIINVKNDSKIYCKNFLKN